MREIIEILNKTKGENVTIHTIHKLFGEQYIEMEFQPETEIGLGFRCREHVICIEYNDIICWRIKDDEIIIQGKMMQIIIKK